MDVGHEIWRSWQPPCPCRQGGLVPTVAIRWVPFLPMPVTMPSRGCCTMYVSLMGLAPAGPARSPQRCHGCCYCGLLKTPCTARQVPPEWVIQRGAEVDNSVVHQDSSPAEAKHANSAHTRHTQQPHWYSSPCSCRSSSVLLLLLLLLLLVLPPALVSWSSWPLLSSNT